MNSAATQHGSANDHHHAGEGGGVAAALGGEAADDGAGQDGDEGRALDQRIAGRQFGFGEVIGEDAVFDRPEQRRDHAEQEQRGEQHGIGMQPEAGDRDRRHRDFDELEPLRHQALSKRSAISPPIAERMKNGKMKIAPASVISASGSCSAHLEQDQEDQRVFQKIVVEGAEELAPEQRRETPRGQEMS